MLFNGFCGYFTHRKRNCLAEAVIPEPGVLWGRFADIPAPVLLTDAPLAETGGFQWLESDTLPALLAVRDGAFCLITKARISSDAVQVAESYFAQDFEAYLANELERRAGAVRLFEQMARHDSLAVISPECMMRALRPPEGNIPGIWSQSPTTDTAQFNINELYPLALAWRQIDIAVAENLVRSALQLQAGSGAIPVTFSPHGSFSVLEAPKPLIAKAAEKVWQVRQDPRFLADILPPLRRHLQWLLHHFDPKRRGLHCWQNSSEPLTPELYESDLATADLTVLLLTEIEAINRLREASPDHRARPAYFTEESDALEHNLQTQFWSEDAGQFCNALVRGRVVQVQGLPAFIPLLWEKLANHQKSLVLDRIKESGTLPGGLSVLSWRKSALDDNSFPLLQQVIVLETLKTADPHGTLVSDFARITLQGFVEWHTLTIEERGTLHLDPVTAAYIMTLQETNHYRYHAKGGIPGLMLKVLRKFRTDRFDLAVAAVTLLAILSYNTMYDIMRRPPPLAALAARMNNAYVSNNGKEALASGMAIINYYPDQSARAKLLAGNILMLNNDCQQASLLLADVRKEYPDSPGAMISLGLAYQLQGRFDEADASYSEFTYLFDEIFPELVAEIQRYRYLMKEGLRTPPKWREIYRYQLMHEL
jgi:tetratricopeptide (TPR) repeat protein